MSQLMMHAVNDIYAPTTLAIKVINFVIVILIMTVASIRVVKNFFYYLQRVA